ncbi:hypothetical protein EIM48_12195 [Pseudoxanthomonas sp. SGNA-20]|uniref:hypothetical protein n=1 Tax=Pseudoxanthomonas sp. SGNA-20 TaxID=2493088 RepID=UPI000F636969|nr:hypothetical protein [Pseudoxanthomonas sp. SGNA-20]RRN55015.1 hypothetical protein EIM48_12195 [Pseudoxanthomonas sp. SGNA-20]
MDLFRRRFAMWFAFSAAIGTGSCAASSPATAPTPSAPAGGAPLPAHRHPIPPRSSPGELVPNTGMRVPRTATAGETFTVSVPVGAVVEAFGEHVEAQAGGEISLQAPEAPGVHVIRVRQSGRASTVLFRITITPR